MRNIRACIFVVVCAYTCQLNGITPANFNNPQVLPEALLARLPALASLHLNWTWSDLSPVFRAAGALRALQSLRAIGNGLTELPPSVGQLTALT